MIKRLMTEDNCIYPQPLPNLPRIRDPWLSVYTNAFRSLALHDCEVRLVFNHGQYQSLI